MAKGGRKNLERILSSASERQAALRSSPNPVRHKKHDTALAITIFCALAVPIVYVLQANGVVTIGWKWSALIYSIVTVLAVVEFYKWEVPTHWNPVSRHLACLLVFTLLLYLSGVEIHSEYRHEHPIKVSAPAPAPEVNVPPPSPLLEVPTVEVRYSPGLLPFSIEPNSSVYLLRLNRRVTDWPDEIRNPSSTAKMEYPPHFPKRSASGPNLDVCEITNHGDRDLVNVQMDFHVSFRGIKSVPITIRRHGQNTSVTFPTRGSNGLTWIEGHGSSGKGFTEGDEILSQNRHVVIPSIEAHHVAFVYVVNASHFPTRFDLPTKITAVVSGHDKPQEVNLIRPNIGIFDVFPWWGLSPSTYKWPRIPDDR